MKHVATNSPWVLVAALGALLLPGGPLGAEEFTFSVDVPADLARTTYLANQTVLRQAGAYSLSFDGPAEGLGPAVNIDAVFVLGPDRFLFSPDAPASIGGIDYEARDVVLYDNGAFSMHTDGEDLRLPEDADIDALSRDPGGNLILSFDAPTTVGLVTYRPEDLAVAAGVDLSLFLSGQSLGLPEDTNVIGYDRTSAVDYFMFDAPVTVGGLTFLPGQIAAHDGNAWSLHWSDGDFPGYAAGTDLSLAASPGEVDDLVLAKNGPDLDLTWDASCSSTATDYAIYEGTIGNWYDHTSIDCSTGGATAETVVPGGGNRYYLVVPHDGATFEGGYGFDSAGDTRPVGAATCLAEQRITGCP